MHKNLIISAFKEAKTREKDKNGTTPSDTAAAKLLSDFICENQKFSFGDRRLIDYYKLALDENNDEVVINKTEVVQALCSYLGYDSFKSFKDANEVGNTVGGNSPEESKYILLTAIRKNKTLSIIATVIISSIIIVMLLIYFSNKERWMVWQNDRYVEVSFDLKKYNFSQLKLYNEYRWES